jgi:hypothetical protein
VSLLAEAIRATPVRRGPRCTFSVMYEALEPDDRADLDACMADEGITGAAIARGLNSIGFDIKQGTVTRHRNGECRCDEAA